MAIYAQIKPNYPLLKIDEGSKAVKANVFAALGVWLH